MSGSRSRFLLLGRPDPFVTAEDEMAFRGKVRIGQQTISGNAGIAFKIVGLAEFSDTEVQKFLTTYLRIQLKDHDPKFLDAFIKRRLQDIKKKDIREVIRKPVHAKMLAALAAAPDWQVDASTEYDLYSHFVNEFLKRELKEKQARTAVPPEERKSFMEQIAWWLWTKRKKISFNIEQIPDSLVTRVRKYFEDGEDSSSIIREMLIGSILGRKMSAELVVAKDEFSFYFPHKSYWEFLVAEYVASPNFNASDLRQFVGAVTPEVLKLLYERTDRAFTGKLYDLIRHYGAALDFEFLKELSKVFRWDSDKLFLEIVEGMLQFSGMTLVCAAASAKAIEFERLGRVVDVAISSRDRGFGTIAVMLANLYVATSKSVEDNEVNYVLDLDCRLFSRIIKMIGLQNLLEAKKTGRRSQMLPNVSAANRRIFEEGVHIKTSDDQDEVVFRTYGIAHILNLELSREGLASLKVDLFTDVNISIGIHRFLVGYVDTALRGQVKRILERGKPKLM